MRRTRRLFLLAIAVILGAVGSAYFRQKETLARQQTPPPPPIKKGLMAASQDWVYRRDDGKCPIIEVRAKDQEATQGEQTAILLTEVQMLLYKDCGKVYDYVRSAKAIFNKGEGTLFSEGEVEITLAVPADQEELAKPGRLVTIQSSGVVVETVSGVARTEALTKFAFDMGEGTAKGANYDPRTREIELFSDVVLNWHGKDKTQKPMRVEAGHLIHKETDSQVLLSPWSRLKRENLTLDAGDAVITLDDGNIRLVEAKNARGTDEYPNRKLTFAAANMVMHMTPKSEVEKIVGNGDAKLEMTAATGETAVSTPTLELDFAVRDGDSVLKTATAQGPSKVESRPAPKAGGPPPPNRVLESDWIVAKMRDNGEEIDAVETAAPGTLRFVPNAPTQPARKMNGERIWIAYGERNQIKSFRAVNVTTETRKPRKAGDKTDPPPALTASQDLTAEFDPETGAMTKLEQWTGFTYKEGTQEATSSHAVLDSKTNLITLAKPAKAWDPSGWVTADQIVLHQVTGDFTAEGNVTSSRQPDRKAASTNAMLSQDEPVKATARRMISTDRNKRIVYEGKVLLSQSANNLNADKVRIDRNAQTLDAEGKVVSQFLDKKADPKTGKPGVTIVHADTMNYNDRERFAHYRGSARMIREGMDVKAKELRAWLNEGGKDGGSSLNRAFADGDVEIYQAEAGRTRLGTAPHAEYYVADEKVVLNGGNAHLTDSLKGNTRGKQLTYFSRNDNLLIEGAPTQPVVSRIKRN